MSTNDIKYDSPIMDFILISYNAIGNEKIETIKIYFDIYVNTSI